MDLKELSDKELDAHYDAVLQEMRSREEKDQLKELKKNTKFLKKVKYIITTKEDTDDEWVFAFSRYKPGWIDDGFYKYTEEEQEVIGTLLEVLGVGRECNSCTYELDQEDVSRVEETCGALGMQKVNPEW